MIDKARCAKHVSNNSLIKFCTKTIRKEKVPQKRNISILSFDIFFFDKCTISLCLQIRVPRANTISEIIILFNGHINDPLGLYASHYRALFSHDD